MQVSSFQASVVAMQTKLKKWADLRLRCCVFCGSAVATDGCFAVFGLRKKKVANERVCVTLCFTAHYEYFHSCWYLESNVTPKVVNKN